MKVKYQITMEVEVEVEVNKKELMGKVREDLVRFAKKGLDLSGITETINKVEVSRIGSTINKIDERHICETEGCLNWNLPNELHCVTHRTLADAEKTKSQRKEEPVCLNDQTAGNLTRYLQRFGQDAKVVIWHDNKEYDCVICCNFDRQLESKKVQLMTSNLIPSKCPECGLLKKDCICTEVDCECGGFDEDCSECNGTGSYMELK